MLNPISLGCLSVGFEKYWGGMGVRRVFVYSLWALGLGWLVVWGVSAMARDSLPSGMVWAFLSMIVWWLVGGASKEDTTKDN
jgi:hypothetical protein